VVFNLGVRWIVSLGLRPILRPPGQFKPWYDLRNPPRLAPGALGAVEFGKPYRLWWVGAFAFAGSWWQQKYDFG